MIQSGHSRRRVPISLSQSEFACGLRAGVVITVSPRRVSEASNSVEKIASWSMHDETIIVVLRNGFSQVLEVQA
jgi:hypothetical protein